ncbi:hypothetical protein [Lentzea sp. NPDC004782]|uniref:hypothetical protein n=1 Tax=Lentzea sp. NPDC004782 TaxID=3154458 RepID=UPI0033AECAD7
MPPPHLAGAEARAREQFSEYRDDWSISWVREDVSRGDKDYEIVGISEAEAVHVKEVLVTQAAEARAAVASHVHYAITDADHPLRGPLALIRTWPNKGLEMVEEYTRASGYGAWEQRKVHIRSFPAFPHRKATPVWPSSS